MFPKYDTIFIHFYLPFTKTIFFSFLFFKLLLFQLIAQLLSIIFTVINSKTSEVGLLSSTSSVETDGPTYMNNKVRGELPTHYAVPESIPGKCIKLVNLGIIEMVLIEIK